MKSTAKRLPTAEQATIDWLSSIGAAKVALVVAAAQASITVRCSRLHDGICAPATRYPDIGLENSMGR
jgi:exopolysaccharide biosynthesis predicted pyruvyltransferase EpsI